MIRVVRTIGVVIILCSIVPFGVSIYCYVKTDNFLEKAVKAHAIVSDLGERETKDGIMYYPVFTFVDRDGIEHNIRSRAGSYPSRYKIGDSIVLFYDPQNPERTEFDSFFSLWLSSVISGVLGIVPVFVGILFVFVVPFIIRRTGYDITTKSLPQMSENHIETFLEDKQDRTWAIFCHLAALAAFLGIPFGNIIGPLIIWLIKRDEIPFVEDHGKESVNFQISVTIYAILSFFMCFLVVGLFLLPAVFVITIVFVIIASVKANRGEVYRYPFTIRFIK